MNNPVWPDGRPYVELEIEEVRYDVHPDAVEQTETDVGSSEDDPHSQ